jgi:hypothetical protein
MEILGLLDALESMILESYKIPVIGKTVVDEAELLAVIDKIRLAAQSPEGFIKGKLDTDQKPPVRQEEQKEVKQTVAELTDTLSKDRPDQTIKEIEAKASEVIQQAYQVAKEIRSGADKYADEVLANLEATSSRIMRTIKNGRLRLSKMLGKDDGGSSLDLGLGNREEGNTGPENQ